MKILLDMRSLLMRREIITGVLNWDQIYKQVEKIGKDVEYFRQ